jgi:hypothetical protein
LSKIQVKEITMSIKQKQLLELTAGLSKSQILSLLRKLIRSADFDADDIPDLEELIFEIEDLTKELEILGNDPNRPSRYIKAQVKLNQRDGVFIANYLYLRRKLPGKAREEKSCGLIPFKPGNIYSIKNKVTGEVKTARCLRIYIPQYLEWEQLLKKPRCHVEIEWLDNASHAYVSNQVFEFPQCMNEDFSPEHCSLKQVVLPQQEIQPEIGHQRIDLSRHTKTSTYSSIPITPDQREGIKNTISNWVEMSQHLPMGTWTLKIINNQVVLTDENLHPVLGYDDHKLFTIISPAAFIDMLERLAWCVNDENVSRSWKEQARNLLNCTRLASKYTGNRAFQSLFRL